MAKIRNIKKQEVRFKTREEATTMGFKHEATGGFKWRTEPPESEEEEAEQFQTCRSLIVERQL